MKYRDGFTPCGPTCSCAKSYEIHDEYANETSAQTIVRLLGETDAQTMERLLGQASVIEQTAQAEQSEVEYLYDEREDDYFDDDRENF